MMNGFSGHPVQIINIAEDNKVEFNLDEEALSSILLNPDVRDKKVVLLSVAGAFRKGKSFLLDFFIRYLSCENRAKWLGDADTPLSGFSWRGGSERDTTGILLWSEPFKMNLLSGEEVVVILMDTQGSFDGTSTVRQCATVFALSTMVSSIQVYNLHGNIQEDNLQHLHLFTEYGRLALESDLSGSPFQIKWVGNQVYGGINEISFWRINESIQPGYLKILPDHHNEHHAVRDHIRTCFSKLDCFLLPHPGLTVATNPKFDGRIKDIDGLFIENLIVLVPHLLSPANLVVKRINGQEVTGRELFTYFKAYMKIYESGNLPEPRSMLEATAEANNLNALMKAQEYYNENMTKICGPEKPYLNPNELEKAHSQTSKKAVERFHSIPKMGGDPYSSEYLKRLNDSLVQMGEDYRTSNAKKSIFQTFRTPGVLAIVLLIFHLVTGVSAFIGLSMLTNALLYPFYIALFTLVTWLFLTYTGRAPEVTQAIDSTADVVMEQVFNPAIEAVGRRGAAHMMGTDCHIGAIHRNGPNSQR